MHNERTTNRMIASFLSRKAEEFPEVFEEIVKGRTIRTNAKTPLLIDIVTR